MCLCSMNISLPFILFPDVFSRVFMHSSRYEVVEIKGMFSGTQWIWWCHRLSTILQFNLVCFHAFSSMEMCDYSNMRRNVMHIHNIYNEHIPFEVGYIGIVVITWGKGKVQHVYDIIWNGRTLIKIQVRCWFLILHRLP